MNETPVAPPRRSFLRAALYAGFIIFVAGATGAVALLWQNISDRKAESLQHAFHVVDVDDDTLDPAEWGKNYPRQYEGYLKTSEIEKTKWGGSENYQKIDVFPVWRTLFKGYAFGTDYREERGHAYMLVDQDETDRVKKFPQPGSCLHCHSSVGPAYREAGRKAGIPDDMPKAQLMKGFELVCAMPYAEARKLVTHPVTCVDCHDPKSMQLRVSKPGFMNGISELAKSDTGDYPHLPSINSWRKGKRDRDYDPNTMASRQEMRSFVCGQCHVEYYFHGKGKLLTFPWHNGIKVNEIETYYDDVVQHVDWTHPDSGAPLLKAQHPEFETWNQGIHARSGVSCADCHMPYKREGSIKISDHHVRSPLLNIAKACQTCHRYPEAELKARAEAIQDRTHELEVRAEQATLELVQSLERARKEGATADQLKLPRALHRKAQWRLDFISAENSRGFHAPHETYRTLGEAIDYARQGQNETTKVNVILSRRDSKAAPKPAEPAGGN